jgi:hypothetical protein
VCLIFPAKQKIFNFLNLVNINWDGGFCICFFYVFVLRCRKLRSAVYIYVGITGTKVNREHPIHFLGDLSPCRGDVVNKNTYHFS